MLGNNEMTPFNSIDILLGLAGEFDVGGWCGTSCLDSFYGSLSRSG